MNKQELIKELREVGIYNLSIFGAEIKGIPTESAIALIEQLDEPETGHADGAPRYLKNILARLQELPLHNREVWKFPNVRQKTSANSLESRCMIDNRY